MSFEANVRILQPIAIFAESAKTFDCSLCGFAFAGEACSPVQRCARCSHAGLFNDVDVARRTMPKCRVEHVRPMNRNDGDAIQ